MLRSRLNHDPRMTNPARSDSSAHGDCYLDLEMAKSAGAEVSSKFHLELTGDLGLNFHGIAVMHRSTTYFVFASLLALLAFPAHAYLDPASGSMILQMVLGGVAGMAVMVKLYWHKLLGLFGRKKHEHDDPAA